MPQDQWQDTLADAAETNEKNPPWEIDVYGVIAHDAPECLRSGGPPSDGRRKGGRVSIGVPHRQRTHQKVDKRCAEITSASDEERAKTTLFRPCRAGRRKKLGAPLKGASRAKTTLFARR